MKHPQKLGQMIFAAVFFCSVIGYGALNLWYAKEPLAENVQELGITSGRSLRRKQ